MKRGDMKMAFNDEDKVTMSELAPTLLEFIKNRASNLELKDHIIDNTRHIMEEERTKWNSILSESQKYTDDQMSRIIGDVLDDDTIAELLKSKVSNSEFDKFKESLSKVAFTGDYVDLENQPTTIRHANESDNTKTINNIKISIGIQQYPVDPKRHDLCVYIDKNGIPTLRVFLSDWVVCGSVII